ncbi:MAG: HAMP domain-containing histidine kinase [Dorea sp.]|nr:HAMP domain-containing histidine kinase [Dorea sp.]
MALHIILLILLFIVIGYSIYRKRKTFQSINRLLDCVLSQEPIALSDTKEGELSALVSKINRIQQVLGKQIMQAEDEKEQVKSLVSNMSHQLKTPLANLSLYTEILSIPQLTEEKKADAAQKLKRQVDKLDWIIGSLAKMVKLEQNAITFDIEPLPIRGTILDAIDTVYEKAEKKHISLTSEPYDDILLYHNRKWTAEVFANLLENAVKYTAPGGAVQISIHPYEIYTEIMFTDNGCGIRGEEIPRIFQRFYRSPETEQTEGSGIGLYLSNLILEKEKVKSMAKKNIRLLP